MFLNISSCELTYYSALYLTETPPNTVCIMISIFTVYCTVTTQQMHVCYNDVDDAFISRGHCSCTIQYSTKNSVSIAILNNK